MTPLPLASGSGDHSKMPLFTPEQVHHINDALQRFGKAYATVLRERVVPALRAFDEAVWKAYRQAGAPYGDTADGRQRWVEEVGRAQRAAADAEYEAMRQIPLRPPRRDP